MKIYQVDAFTDEPFKGNPAAVCILSEERSAPWMQSLAMEMNLSETAFLLRQKDGFGLRWFTPKLEVDLCGHATLASSHVLWEFGFLKKDQQARFHTKSGLLTARKKGGWVEMNFPKEPEKKTLPPKELAKALGVKPVYVGKNRLGYLAELSSEKEVRQLEPDFSLLARLPLDRVMVTAKASTKGFDFVSRYFAPGAGVPEDPVTGSAHCCLGPYWQKRLGKSEFTAYQASKRGGVVKVRVGKDRVFISGKAVTVMVGDARLDLIMNNVC